MCQENFQRPFSGLLGICIHISFVADPNVIYQILLVTKIPQIAATNRPPHPLSVVMALRTGRCWNGEILQCHRARAVPWALSQTGNYDVRSRDRLCRGVRSLVTQCNLLDYLAPNDLTYQTISWHFNLRRHRRREK